MYEETLDFFFPCFSKVRTEQTALYHLFERGGRKSLGKVKPVRDRSSKLAVAPKGGKCRVIVL